jgi:hypothetical protein
MYWNNRDEDKPSIMGLSYLLSPMLDCPFTSPPSDVKAPITDFG